VAGKDSKGKFVIREAREEDLPEMVGFLAKLALHVSGAPPHDLKESEHKRLLRTLHASLDDPNRRLVVADSKSAGLVGMGYVYIWRSQGCMDQAGFQTDRGSRGSVHLSGEAGADRITRIRKGHRP